MKKTLLTVTLIGTVFVMSAQDKPQKTVKTTGGVKIETNFSNFLVSGVSGAKSTIKTGTTLGGFLRWDATKCFFIQGELLFHYKTSDFVFNHVKSEFRYAGVEIPIYAVWNWRFKEDELFYVGIGPHSEFGFAAQMKRNGEKINLYEKDDETELSAMKDFNSGFGIIIGYEFAYGIQISACYKISITNVLDANSSEATVLPQAISLGVAYRFGK